MQTHQMILQHVHIFISKAHHPLVRDREGVAGTRTVVETRRSGVEHRGEIRIVLTLYERISLGGIREVLRDRSPADTDIGPEVVPRVPRDEAQEVITRLDHDRHVARGPIEGLTVEIHHVTHGCRPAWLA